MWHILRTHKQQINKNNKTTTNRKPNYFPARRTVFGKWPTKGRMTKGQPNETILSISAVPGYNPPPFPLHSFLLLPHPTPLEAQLSRTFGRKTPMNHHRRSRRMNTSRLGLFLRMASYGKAGPSFHGVSASIAPSSLPPHEYNRSISGLVASEAGKQSDL